MHRKLYALLILIGAIGGLVLVYMYFFVYYTGSLQLESSDAPYEVELFAPSTALKTTHNCPEQICMISGVSPFEYTMTVKKDGFKSSVSSIKVLPRKLQVFTVSLEKQARLTQIEADIQEMTKAQIIQAKRDEKRFYTYFNLSESSKLTLTEDGTELIVSYQNENDIFELTRVPIIPKDRIQSEYISDSGDVFLSLGSNYYIFKQGSNTLSSIKIEIPIKYIKKTPRNSEYLIVTKKGSFLWNISTQKIDFQYLFKDFIYFGDKLVGIIYKDEKQKKENFNLEEPGNLIILYSQDTKERKVLLATLDDIDRIEYINEQVIVSKNGSEYILENFY